MNASAATLAEQSLVIAPAFARSIMAALLAALAFAWASHASAAGRSHALLIGVAHYRATPELVRQGYAGIDLDGPANDVRALRDVLRRRWGFADENIRTLIDVDATRQGILDGLADLAEQTAPGDRILVYFSGHGTSADDPRLGPPVPHGSGAFAPHDLDYANLGETLLVGRTDLIPAFKALEHGGRRV